MIGTLRKVTFDDKGRLALRGRKLVHLSNYLCVMVMTSDSITQKKSCQVESNIKGAIKALVEKTSSAVIFWPLYATILTLSICASRRQAITNATVQNHSI